MKLKLTTLIAIFTLIFSATAMAGGHASAEPMKKDIVDTAVSAGSFNTLVAAVQAAGLVDALKKLGTYRMRETLGKILLVPKNFG